MRGERGILWRLKGYWWGGQHADQASGDAWRCESPGHALQSESERLARAGQRRAAFSIAAAGRR